jgi:hypothetical protein
MLLSLRKPPDLVTSQALRDMRSTLDFQEISPAEIVRLAAVVLREATAAGLRPALSPTVMQLQLSVRADGAGRNIPNVVTVA